MTYPHVTPASGNTITPVTPGGAQANQGVGAGSAGQVPGAIPPANADGLTLYSGAVIASLGAELEDSSVMSLEVAAHLQDVCQKLYAGEVSCDDAQRQAALANKMAQLKDALDKLAHLQDDHHSFWDILGDVLGAIASVLAIVVGVLLCVVPGGQVLGALCIAGGVIGLLSTANSITAQVTGHGIAGNIYLAFNPGDEKGAEEADLACSITLAVLSVACAVVCFCVDAPEAVSSVLNAMQTISASVSAGSTIVTAAGEVSVAVIDYNNAEKQAAAKRDQAEAANLAAWITEIDHFIDLALKNMKASADAWASTVRSAADTMSYTNEVALQTAGRFAA